MRYFLLLLGFTLLAVAGCDRGPERDAMSEPAPPPAAMIAPVRESMSLQEKLLRLDQELAAAVRDGIDSGGVPSLHRAESITDRLLESRPPFEWTAGEYAVEARLRQLQARADRLVAEQRRDADPERLAGEVAALRREVESLRSELAEQGGAAPPSLDSLLAGPPADTLSGGMPPQPGGE